LLSEFLSPNLVSQLHGKDISKWDIPPNERCCKRDCLQHMNLGEINHIPTPTPVLVEFRFNTLVEFLFVPPFKCEW
jgi:hypothetical protein